MKGATLADAAIMSTEIMYKQISQLKAKNDKLQIENQLLKALII